MGRGRGHSFKRSGQERHLDILDGGNVPEGGSIECEKEGLEGVQGMLQME